MNNTDEIIKKYFEKHPDVKVLAEKYGLKNEFIVVDPFDEERFVLNPECFDKYLKAYEFSFSEDGKKILSEIQEKGDSIEISAALTWVDRHYDEAIKYRLEKILKETKATIDYTGLSNIITKVIGLCSFSLQSLDINKIKEVANYLKGKFNNIIWDENEYDIYYKLILINRIPSSNTYVNYGLEDCINDSSLDILDVLRVIYNVKSFYNDLNLDKRFVDKLLNDEIDNCTKYVSTIYDRLKNEKKLKIVIDSPNTYAFSKEIAEYAVAIGDSDYTYNLTENNDESYVPILSTVDSYIPSITSTEASDIIIPSIDDEIVNDVEICLEKYVGADLTKSDVVDIITRDVIETLYSMDKEQYNTEALFYNQDTVISSIFEALQKNGINASKSKIKENIELAERNIKPIVINVNSPIDDDNDNNINQEDVHKIFNELPENEVKINLQNIYYNDNNSSKIILKEYAKFINASMYGTLRDTSTIEKQFTSFCSENGINYTDEFINSLPDIIKDKYKNPVVKKEKTERKGQVFNILKRYNPKTSVKTQKRLYATLAGVGIMSFLFMTTVKVLSPDSAADSCTETFEKLLHSELLANIFGDVKTYFASIAASIGGGIGYIVKDEKESKSRRM